MALDGRFLVTGFGGFRVSAIVGLNLNMSSPLYTLKTNKAFCRCKVIPSGNRRLLELYYGYISS